MAIQATQPFMHPGGCAIIRGTKLAEGIGGVALRAKPLARVRGDFDGAIALGNGRDGQQVGGERCLLAPDIQVSGLKPGGRGVNLMAGQAWDRRLAGLGCIFQRPGAGGRNGRCEVFDISVKKHSVAAQTVGRKLLGSVVRDVKKDLRVSCRMAAALPISKTLRVAAAASLLQGNHMPLCQTDGLVRRTPEVLHHAVDVRAQGVDVECQRTPVAVAAVEGAM